MYDDLEDKSKVLENNSRDDNIESSKGFLKKQLTDLIMIHPNNDARVIDRK